MFAANFDERLGLITCERGLFRKWEKAEPSLQRMDSSTGEEDEPGAGVEKGVEKGDEKSVSSKMSRNMDDM